MEEKEIKEKEAADRLSALEIMDVMVMIAKKERKMDDPETRSELRRAIKRMGVMLGYRDGVALHSFGDDSYGVLVLHSKTQGHATIHVSALEKRGEVVVEKIVELFTNQ